MDASRPICESRTVDVGHELCVCVANYFDECCGSELVYTSHELYNCFSNCVNESRTVHMGHELCVCVTNYFDECRCSEVVTLLHGCILGMKFNW